MIKYMVVHFQWNPYDSWLNILERDFSDIQAAENYRSHYIDQFKADPDNVSVIQYKE